MSWISVNAPLISVSILKMSVIADFGCTNWTTFWVRLYNMLELLHHLASAKSWRNISEVADNFRCNVSNSSAYTICLLDKNSTAVLPSEQKKMLMWQVHSEMEKDVWEDRRGRFHDYFSKVRTAEWDLSLTIMS